MATNTAESHARSNRPIYDFLAAHYDQAMRPLDHLFLARLRAETLSQLPESARILELGAGTGLNFPFYPDNTSGVASEPNHEMLKIARNKSRPAAVRLVQTCAETLPFNNASFDAAFATLVFCSVVSPRQAFTELRRVVKPAGTILLLEHVRPNGLLGPIFDLLNLVTARLCDDHFNRRTAAAARAAGFQSVHVEKRMLGTINLIVCRV
jgi:phosphatidylethanolamine/phosphatidyl-N-methylethanolamine N-methyltransferase